MKKIYMFFLMILLSACSTSAHQEGSFKDVTFPQVHLPSSAININELEAYKIAYCWRSLERDNFGRGRTDLILQLGDNSSRKVISIPSSPPKAIQNLACVSQNDNDFRTGNYTLIWNPNDNELLMNKGFSVFFTEFYSVKLSDELNVVSEIPQFNYKQFFLYPYDFVLSPKGESIATIAQDGSQSTRNVWLFDISQNDGNRLTNYQSAGNYLMNLSWAPDGKFLAIGHGYPISGISIIELNELASFPNTVYITNEREEILTKWPTDLFGDNNFFSEIFSSKPLSLFQTYLGRISRPVWTNNSKQVIFSAPTFDDRVALFVVDINGENLRELLPELPGLSILPKLSPDGSKLVFVRYPSWKNTDNAELLLFSMETGAVLSLIVLPEPPKDRLFISGIAWSPDGKYLAFSSNHEGRSNIYILESDGGAWLNLTKDLEGDKVNPTWIP